VRTSRRKERSRRRVDWKCCFLDQQKDIVRCVTVSKQLSQFPLLVAPVLARNFFTHSVVRLVSSFDNENAGTLIQS